MHTAKDRSRSLATLTSSLIALTLLVASCSSSTGSGATSTSTTTAEGSSTFELVAATAATGTVTHGDFTFAGRERTYRLYVPHALPSGPVPLFIGLHGGTGWGDQFARTNHIEGLAESNGFIVVHPDGVKVAGGPGGVWNGGDCCGIAAREKVDDVGFVNALIDQLETQYSIDPHRIYAFGHSNGAIMSYRLACELSGRIVGIGLYAGTLGIEPCNPAQPVSILHVHGTADANIPLAGGVGSDGISGVSFPPPRDGFDQVARLDGCPPPTKKTVGDVTTERSDSCTGGTAAAFVTIATATHSWPAGTPIITPASGPGYADYDATAAIVTFLLSHPRP
ncbi:MAG: alpha/beta hydrolase family esterase [Ilumatobacteraceae bacterium]